jgi:hypothetical protein
VYYKHEQSSTKASRAKDNAVAKEAIKQMQRRCISRSMILTIFVLEFENRNMRE